MELLFKITPACNFNCSFCSASNLKMDKFEDIKDKFYKKLIDENPSMIYIDGGDPLLVDPQIYWDMIDFIKQNNLQTKQISLTSNLWDFYKNPDKWVSLFKNPMIEVATSFQYGNKRISPNGVFTEQEFREIITLFKDKVGYTPFFIAVIDEENEDSWKKTALLAKELNAEFRLNPVNAAGRSGDHFYPRYKMIKIWIELAKLGFKNLEGNLKAYRAKQCPFTFNCTSTLYAFRYENGVEKGAPCSTYLELSSENPTFKDKRNLPFIDRCPQCPLFSICCACAGQRYQINSLSENDKEFYCSEMLKLKDEVQKWLE